MDASRDGAISRAYRIACETVNMVILADIDTGDAVLLDLRWRGTCSNVQSVIVITGFISSASGGVEWLSVMDSDDGA